MGAYMGAPSGIAFEDPIEQVLAETIQTASPAQSADLTSMKLSSARRAQTMAAKTRTRVQNVKLPRRRRRVDEGRLIHC